MKKTLILLLTFAFLLSFICSCTQQTQTPSETSSSLLAENQQSTSSESTTSSQSETSSNESTMLPSYSIFPDYYYYLIKADHAALNDMLVMQYKIKNGMYFGEICETVALPFQINNAKLTASYRIPYNNELGLSQTVFYYAHLTFSRDEKNLLVVDSITYEEPIIFEKGIWEMLPSEEECSKTVKAGMYYKDICKDLGLPKAPNGETTPTWFSKNGKFYEVVLDFDGKYHTVKSVRSGSIGEDSNIYRYYMITYTPPNGFENDPDQVLYYEPVPRKIVTGFNVNDYFEEGSKIKYPSLSAATLGKIAMMKYKAKDSYYLTNHYGQHEHVNDENDVKAILDWALLDWEIITAEEGKFSDIVGSISVSPDNNSIWRTYHLFEKDALYAQYYLCGYTPNDIVNKISEHEPIFTHTNEQRSIYVYNADSGNSNEKYIAYIVFGERVYVLTMSNNDYIEDLQYIQVRSAQVVFDEKYEETVAQQKQLENLR